MFETNAKLESLSKERKILRKEIKATKNQMESLETKNPQYWNIKINEWAQQQNEIRGKNLWNWRQSNRNYPIWRTKRKILKNVARTSGTYRIISKGLILMSLESKKHRMLLVSTKYWRNNRTIVPNLGERNKRTDMRNAVISTMHTHKENHVKNIIIKLPKTKDEVSWKQLEKNTHYS